MRLRANYRDFAFIEGVSSEDTAAYFNDYFAFAKHLYRALRGLQTQLCGRSKRDRFRPEPDFLSSRTQRITDCR
jgi:hypothetical protein